MLGIGCVVGGLVGLDLCLFCGVLLLLRFAGFGCYNCWFRCWFVGFWYLALGCGVYGCNCCLIAVFDCGLIAVCVVASVLFPYVAL